MGHHGTSWDIMGYRESFIITALSPLFDFVHHRLARKQQSSNEKDYRHDK